MAKDKINIPQIRFKGFEGEWERDVLKKIAKINPTSNLPDKFKYIDLESVKGSSLIDYRIEYKNKAPSRAQRVAEKGDIFYQTVRPYQKNNYLFELFEKNYVFSTGYAQIRPLKNITSKFLFSLIQSEKFVNKVLVRCTGTSYPAINSTELSLIDVRYPLLKEQTQIGDFFQKIDQVIELQQKALDTARAYKQSMLQKMFPQKGEKVPRVRFKGFSGDWGNYVLGQCFLERNERSSEGELLSVTINNGVIPSADLNRHDNSSEDKRNYKRIYVNDIAYNSMRMWQGASGRSDYDGIASPAYTVITPKKNIDSLYFSYYFKTSIIINEFRKNSQGLVSDTWNLKYPLLKSIKVLVPKIEEQTAIGNFFQKLDQQIEQQAQKLATYQQLKKAMLQRMFV